MQLSSSMLEKLAYAVIHPLGHVLQLNFSKGFVPRNNFRNSLLFTVLFSFKIRFSATHCFTCQHRRVLGLGSKKSDNISFRTIVAKTSDSRQCIEQTAWLFDFRNFIWYGIMCNPVELVHANQPRACCSSAIVRICTSKVSILLPVQFMLLGFLLLHRWHRLNQVNARREMNYRNSRIKNTSLMNKMALFFSRSFISAHFCANCFSRRFSIQVHKFCSFVLVSIHIGFWMFLYFVQFRYFPVDATSHHITKRCNATQ